jgi:hypothetical protein
VAPLERAKRPFRGLDDAGISSAHADYEEKTGGKSFVHRRTFLFEATTLVSNRWIQ